jgi:hypothetical protein
LANISAQNLTLLRLAQDFLNKRSGLVRKDRYRADRRPPRRRPRLPGRGAHRRARGGRPPRGDAERFIPLLKPRRELNPRRAELPETLEDRLIGGVLRVLNQRLIAGETEALKGLLPETIELVLR